MAHPRFLSGLLFSAFLLVACRDDRPQSVDAGRDASSDTGGPPAVDGGADAGRPDDAGTVDAARDGGITLCPRAPSPADGMRTLVMSHPSLAGGGASNRYRAVAVSEEGELMLPGMEFEMGRAVSGRIAVFTPDGEIGIVPQELGTLGVFRVTGPGTVEVVDPSFEPSFPTGAIVMHPDGDRVWVLGRAFRASGGGIYELGITCEGNLVELSTVTEAKMPWVGTFLPDGKFLLGGEDVGDSTLGDDAHLLAADPFTVLSGTDAFGNMEDRSAIPSAIDATADGAYGILSENSLLGRDMPRYRLAMVRIEPSALSTQARFWPVEACANPDDPSCVPDPAGIVASPFNDVVLVAAADRSDAIFRFDYDPANTTEPFTFAGEISYSDAGPSLPVAMAAIERGTLLGHVFVAEVSQIRRLRFEGGGVVTDLGVVVLGGDGENNIGAFGITP